MAIRIVTGAPCSGKTSYVQSHAQEGEVIIDYDLIAKAIGAGDHRPAEPYRSTAFVMRRAGIDDVLEKGTPAWIIHTDPSAQQVAKYAAAGAEFFHMDASMEECLERAKDRPEGTAEAIRDYFAAREEKGVPAMETKSIDLLVKEAPGDVPGIIAYASTFDRIPDAYGDVVAKGAFAGTLARLKESGNNLPLLYGHVMDQPENIIGTVVKAEEDDHGLLVEAVFDMENPKAQTVHRAVLSKAITKLSFAFTVLDDHTITLEDYGEVRELTELEIYEVSLVVVPANPRAQVVSAKDAEPETKMTEEHLGVDTEPETEPEEVKAEEPEVAKAEEHEEKAEEEEPETIPIESEKEKPMELETMNAIAEAQPAEKSLREIVTATFVGKGLKDGGRFSVATPEIKAFAGTPKWLPTVSRNVAGIGPDYTFADLFGQEVISGNSYTFARLSAGETFAQVAEGGAKPDATPTSTIVNLPLIKVAGLIQESDELIEDADWLVSAIENRGVRNYRRARDGYAMGTLLGTSGIGSISTGINEANILAAIGRVKAGTGHDADAIVVNPETYVSLVSAALNSSHSLFSPDYKSILGVPVYQVVMDDAAAIVGAFRDGATLVTKGGIRVEATNSDQDDFIHNLVKVRIEQRLALAVREPAAFVKVEAGGGD